MAWHGFARLGFARLGTAFHGLARLWHGLAWLACVCALAFSFAFYFWFLLCFGLAVAVAFAFLCLLSAFVFTFSCVSLRWLCFCFCLCHRLASTFASLSAFHFFALAFAMRFRLAPFFACGPALAFAFSTHTSQQAVTAAALLLYSLSTFRLPFFSRFRPLHSHTNSSYSLTLPLLALALHSCDPLVYVSLNNPHHGLRSNQTQSKPR